MVDERIIEARSDRGEVVGFELTVIVINYLTLMNPF
jgi:hypothetical protein